MRVRYIAVFFVLLFLELSGAPGKWVADIDKLTAGDVAHPFPAGGIVFAGSSSIRLWTSLAEDFPGMRVINRGFGGSELADSVYYADRIVISYRPKVVVLYAGENDLWAGVTPEKVAADFTAFRRKVHAALPDVRIFFLSIKPSPSREKIIEKQRLANRLIAADCATDARCTFVDVATPMLGANGHPRPELFAADQLHMNASGYALWAGILNPLLKSPGAPQPMAHESSP